MAVIMQQTVRLQFAQKCGNFISTERTLNKTLGFRIYTLYINHILSDFMFMSLWAFLFISVRVFLKNFNKLKLLSGTVALPTRLRKRQFTYLFTPARAGININKRVARIRKRFYYFNSWPSKYEKISDNLHHFPSEYIIEF